MAKHQRLEHMLDLARTSGNPVLMGVLNVTPDSFSDGNIFFETNRAIERGLEMAARGAGIIDVGGESTRPGAEPVPEEEELRRIIPVISALRNKTDALVSVDTYKASVASAALDAGAHIVNDISGLGFDGNMAGLVAERAVPVILMHIKGEPRDMQENPEYSDVVGEVRTYFESRVEYALSCGVHRDQIIIDPGIGFGKKLEHNIALIRAAQEFKSMGYPLLYGVSRKSFIGNILDLPVEDRLEGTIAANLFLAGQGVEILRVHDVREVGRALRVFTALMKK